MTATHLHAIRRPVTGWRHLLMLLAAWLLALPAASPVQADTVAAPALTARVTDQAGLLDAGRRAALEQALAAFEARKGSQIAVLTVPTTGDETIEQFGIRVAEQWKIGRKGVDDGAILIIARDDRTLRIEVGYGLEGVIPDAIARRVIAETIVPRFQAGDFAGGIEAGAGQLMQLVDGEPLPPPPARQAGGQTADSPLGALLIAALVIGQILRSLLGPLLAGLLVGAGSFGLGWALTGALGPALLLGAGGFFVTLLGVMGMIGSGGGRGGGFGGSRGGFGGGGFGGGGGGFGGGGASGRW